MEATYVLVDPERPRGSAPADIELERTFVDLPLPILGWDRLRIVVLARI